MARLFVLVVLVCGCASTLSARPTRESYASSASEKIVARCRLVGPMSGLPKYNPRNAILDETLTMGPSRIFWVNPRAPSMIKTDEGLVYSCDATL